MSKETPKDDPRQRSDQGSHKQTDKPWKGNPEKEQRIVTPISTLRSGTDQHTLSERTEWDLHLTRSSATRANGECTTTAKLKMSTRQKRPPLRPP